MERSSNFSDSMIAGGRTVGTAAALTTSFRHPFIYDGRYACYDNPGCDLDDESGPEEEEESDDEKLDIAKVKRTVGSAYERVVEGLGDSQDTDGYDGDSDEYGDGYGDGFYSYHRHDMFGDDEEEGEDDDGDHHRSRGVYTTYEEFTAQELQDLMHQQQQSMLDYAYSLRRYSLLETIHEETAEELRSDSESRSEVSDNYSGVWCWGDDFTDGTESVIYIEQPQDSEGHCGHASAREQDNINGISEGIGNYQKSVVSDGSSDEDGEEILSPVLRCTSQRGLEDPSEREGSWLDAEVDESVDDNGSNSVSSTCRSGHGAVNLTNGVIVSSEESDGDSQADNSGENSLSLFEDEPPLIGNISSTTSPESTNKGFECPESGRVSAEMPTTNINTFGDQDGQALVDTYQSILSLRNKSPTGDESDLLIVFDDMEGEDLSNHSPVHVVPSEGKKRYHKRPSSAPPPPPTHCPNRVPVRTGDSESETVSDSSGNSEFSSWSDAIDAYLMSRAAHQQRPVTEKTPSLPQKESHHLSEVNNKRNLVERTPAVPAKVQRLTHYQESDDGNLSVLQTRSVDETNADTDRDGDEDVGGARGEGKSCHGSVILGSDLSLDLQHQDAPSGATASSLKEDIYSAPSDDCQRHESPTSSPKDEPLVAFGRLETMVCTAGDGTNQPTNRTEPLKDQQRTLPEVKQKLLLRCHQELRWRRLSGTNSAPDLRLVGISNKDDQDAIPVHCEFGEFTLDHTFSMNSIDDSYSLKSQSVPMGIDREVMDGQYECHQSRNGNRRPNAGYFSGGVGYKGDVFNPPSPLKRQSFTFDGMGNDLSACELDNLHYSKTFSSRFSPTYKGRSSHSSSCGSDQDDVCDTADSVEEEEEDEDNDDEDEGVDDLSTRGSLSLFPRFTPPGTLRSFRSFDTLHLTGKNDDNGEPLQQCACEQPSPPPSLRNHHHSWMDGIEECSEREETTRPTRPSSENLSEDSGYCDSSHFGRVVSGNGQGTVISSSHSGLDGQTSEVQLSTQMSEVAWGDRTEDEALLIVEESDPAKGQLAELSGKGRHSYGQSEESEHFQIYSLNEMVIAGQNADDENFMKQKSTADVLGKGHMVPVDRDVMTGILQPGQCRENQTGETQSLPVDNEVSGSIEGRLPLMEKIITTSCRGDKRGVDTKECGVHHLDIVNHPSGHPCENDLRQSDSPKPSSLPSLVSQQQLEYQTSCLYQKMQKNDVNGTIPPPSDVSSPLRTTSEPKHAEEVNEKTEKCRNENGPSVLCSAPPCQLWPEECGRNNMDQHISALPSSGPDLVELLSFKEQKGLVERVTDSASEQLPIVSNRLYLAVHMADVTRESHNSNWCNPVRSEIPRGPINEEFNSRTVVEAPPLTPHSPLHSSPSSPPSALITYSSPHLSPRTKEGHKGPSDGEQVQLQDDYSLIADGQVLHLQDSAAQHGVIAEEKDEGLEAGRCRVVAISREEATPSSFVMAVQGRLNNAAASKLFISDLVDPVTAGKDPMMETHMEQEIAEADKLGSDRDHDYIMETEITLDILSDSTTLDHRIQNELVYEIHQENDSRSATTVCSSSTRRPRESLSLLQIEGLLSGSDDSYQHNVRYQKTAKDDYSLENLSAFQSATSKMTSSTNVDPSSSWTASVVDSGPVSLASGGAGDHFRGGRVVAPDSHHGSGYNQSCGKGKKVRLDAGQSLTEASDGTTIKTKTELRLGRCRNSQEVEDEKKEEETVDAEAEEAEALSAGRVHLVESTFNATSSNKSESVCATTELKYVHDGLSPRKRPGDDVRLEFKTEVITSRGSLGGEEGRGGRVATEGASPPVATTIKTTTDIIVISTLGGTTTTSKSFVSGTLPVEGVVGNVKEAPPRGLDQVKTDGERELEEEKEVKTTDGKCGPFQRKHREEEEEPQQQCLELLHSTSLNSNPGFQSALVRGRQRHRETSSVANKPESRVRFDVSEPKNEPVLDESSLSSHKLSPSVDEIQRVDDERVLGENHDRRHHVGTVTGQNVVSDSLDCCEKVVSSSAVPSVSDQNPYDMEKKDRRHLWWTSSPSSKTTSFWNKEYDVEEVDAGLHWPEETSRIVSLPDVDDHHWDGSSIDWDSDETESLTKEDNQQTEAVLRKSDGSRQITDSFGHDEFVNGSSKIPSGQSSSSLAFGTAKECLTPGKPPLPPHHHHHHPQPQQQHHHHVSHHGQHQTVPKQVAVCRSKIIDAREQFLIKSVPSTSPSSSKEPCDSRDFKRDDNSNVFEIIPMMTQVKKVELASLVSCDNNDEDNNDNLEDEGRWHRSGEAAGASGACNGEEMQRVDVLQALEKCRQKALEGRERVAKTVYDLNQVERAVRIQQKQQQQQQQQQQRQFGAGGGGHSIDPVLIGVVSSELEGRRGFCSSDVGIADNSSVITDARRDAEATETFSSIPSNGILASESLNGVSDHSWWSSPSSSRNVSRHLRRSDGKVIGDYSDKTGGAPAPGVNVDSSERQPPLLSQSEKLRRCNSRESNGTDDAVVVEPPCHSGINGGGSVVTSVSPLSSPLTSVPPSGGLRRSSYGRKSSAASSASWRGSNQSIGYLETDIDTLHSREVIRVTTDSSNNSSSSVADTAEEVLTEHQTAINGKTLHGFDGIGSVGKHQRPRLPYALKTQSMFNLTAENGCQDGDAGIVRCPLDCQLLDGSGLTGVDGIGGVHHKYYGGTDNDSDSSSRAKSVEFLLKDENKMAALPPENRLQQQVQGSGGRDGNSGGGGGFHDGTTIQYSDEQQRVLSEHELRIRRSLQKLDLPQWYTNSPISQLGSAEGFILRKDQSQTSLESGSRYPRWVDIRSSKSSSNLGAGSGSTAPRSSSTSTSRNVVIPKRVTTADMRHVKSSRESLLQSPLSPSPLPSPKDKSGNFHYYGYASSSVMSRWSSSRFSTSTTASSRSTSPTGSLQYQRTLPFQRQPYLGWRSSERLAREMVNVGQSSASGADNASSTPTHAGYFYRSSAERLSQGPGYYALRFGLYRSPGSDGNLVHHGFSRRGSNTSTATAPPDSYRTGRGDSAASPVSVSNISFKSSGGFDESFHISHHGDTRPEITVNVIEPNGGYRDDVGRRFTAARPLERSPDTGGLDNDQNQGLQVADLVREIDKLIHRNGATVENGGVDCRRGAHGQRSDGFPVCGGQQQDEEDLCVEGPRSVTSAVVHQDRESVSSPTLSSKGGDRQKVGWMESSFVGVRPIRAPSGGNSPPSPPENQDARGGSPQKYRPSSEVSPTFGTTTSSSSPTAKTTITSQAQVHPPPPALFRTPSLFKQATTQK